ncbi:polyprenyl synthetase family protein [Streptomyces sp. NRRL WC-3549]|uniref:polyprenyl synthetase family protein n=1 Tax=Streptomyces sp. NRRL WC-3549 TaxID=1463925 RepID=UPI0004C5BB34|nr:polyprenyl synthetase family protein [Streptomyces sp. NRRL WC-3549]
MYPQAPTTGALDLADLRERIDTTLADFLRRPLQRVPAQNRRRSHRHDLDRTLTDYVLAPGKRVRPLLCVIGWHAAGGGGSEETVLRLAASLELFHAFALIHDDIMDDSDTRRGLPSAHRAFAVRHRDRPDANTFGRNLAVLLGDLALVRCDEMLHNAGFTEQEHRAVLPLVDTMRDEVVLGQYLDLHTTGSPTGDTDRALTVIRLKTAKYTIERPLHLGAALAGAGTRTLDACSAYALPLGEAFQLRDDLLGTFGDPAVTGKPVIEDLRSGKATVLMALAVRRAAPHQAELLDRLVGDPGLDEEGAMSVRRVLEATGARATVERMIHERYATALAALSRSPFAPAAVTALRRIAAGAVSRTA